MSRAKQIAKQVEKLAEQEKPAVKRRFAGFKAELDFKAEGLSILTAIRYEKLKAEDIIEIIRRSVNGKPVIGKYGKKQYFEVDEAGKPIDEIQEQEIKHYQVIDGEEIEVGKFDRTKILETIALIERIRTEDYLFESFYELWSENIATLWQIAEYLDKQDKAIASQFTFGGYKAYTAIIYPIIDRDQGRFVLVMGLTNTKKLWKHMMDINGRDAVQQVSDDGKAKPKVKLVM